MPYKAQISKLETLIRTTDNEIFSIEKSGTSTSDRLEELKKKKQEYQMELRRLNRLQWDHDHNSVDFGDY